MSNDTESSTRNAGRFVWHDLMTRDPDLSREFYEELFGWRVEREQSNGSHVVLSTPEEVVAGLLPLGSDEELINRWMPYVAVDDVTEPPSRALSLGGEAPLRDETSAGSGRISIVSDPHGGTLTAIDGQFPTPDEAADQPPHGTFCWHEVVTSDPELTKTFYTKVFDWSVSCVPQGDLGTYWMLNNGSVGVAGVRPAPPLPTHQAFWLCFVAADDVDESALRAEQLYGRVLTDPLDVPGFGRFSTLADPLGGVFAILKNERK
jgi:predicted enzyme related to lactoylglutathione lyase